MDNPALSNDHAVAGEMARVEKEVRADERLKIAREIMSECERAISKCEMVKGSYVNNYLIKLCDSLTSNVCESN